MTFIAGAVTTPSRLRSIQVLVASIDFTSSSLTVYLGTLYSSLVSIRVALDTKAMLGGLLYQKNLTRRMWHQSIDPWPDAVTTGLLCLAIEPSTLLGSYINRNNLSSQDLAECRPNRVT